MRKFNKNDLVLIWGVVVFIALAVGMTFAQGVSQWFLIAVMIGHLVVTINKIGKK